MISLFSRNSLLFLFSFSFFASFSLKAADRIQDPEAIYLTSLPSQKPLLLKIQETTGVYATRTFQARLRNFTDGTEVQLIAYSPKSYLVKNPKTKHEGWVKSIHIEKIDPKVLEKLLAEAKEEQTFQEAIKNKEVLAGMTFEHVKKALGKPSEKSFRQDENGRYDQWSYIEYKSTSEVRPIQNPQTGEIFYQSHRVKIPVGSLDIEFKNGRVSAIQKTSGNHSSGKRY